jgi:hypothetical protein
MVTRKTLYGTGRLAGVVMAGALVLGMGAVRPAMAAGGPDETARDSTTLLALEQKAEHAEAREQCYLYSEVLHGLTELAGRQMAAGQDDEAGATMLHIDVVAAKVEHASANDAKRLKNAEMLLEHTSHRLADMVRVASSGERLAMQSTLQHLNLVHTKVLALVFAQ